MKKIYFPIISLLLVGCHSAYVEPQSGDFAYINTNGLGIVTMLWSDSRECRDGHGTISTPYRYIKISANKEISIGSNSWCQGYSEGHIVTFIPQKDTNYVFFQQVTGGNCEIHLLRDPTVVNSSNANQKGASEDGFSKSVRDAKLITQDAPERFRARKSTIDFQEFEPGCKLE